MSKELTPLEALENIKKLFIGSSINLSKQFDIIEKALKDHTKIKELFEKFGIEDVYNLEVRLMNYELGEKVLKDYGLTLAEFRRACLTYTQFKNCKADKNLKALVIIKEKEIDVYLLSGCKKVSQYNNSVDLYEIPNKRHLTQEEFNLLKEVLK